MGPAPVRGALDGVSLSGPRARVLELLQQAPSEVTVDEAAERLGLHANTARKHLEGLVESGVATRRSAASSGRGRPAQLYTAERDGEPDPRVRGYAELAAALAQQLGRCSPDPRSDALEAGTAWGRALARGAATGTPAGARRAVVRLLAELGYAPEPNRLATSVRLRRCPLLDAARSAPEVVCRTHLGLVRGALDVLGGHPQDAVLEPFAEPGACLLRLSASGHRLAS